MTPAVRVWRVRKNSTWLDARLEDGGDANGVELQFFRDNTLISTRRWPSREDALAAAARQLEELRLAGWNTHW
jgi:hypothetical protein